MVGSRDIGKGEELSVVLAVVKAVMNMGHSDLRLYLSLDPSALFISASAPISCPSLPRRLCLNTVCSSLCVDVCVCESQLKHETTEGEPWRGLRGQPG